MANRCRRRFRPCESADPVMAPPTAPTVAPAGGSSSEPRQRSSSPVGRYRQSAAMATIWAQHPTTCGIEVAALAVPDRVEPGDLVVDEVGGPAKHLAHHPLGGVLPAPHAHQLAVAGVTSRLPHPPPRRQRRWVHRGSPGETLLGSPGPTPSRPPERPSCGTGWTSKAQVVWPRAPCCHGTTQARRGSRSPLPVRGA